MIEYDLMDHGTYVDDTVFFRGTSSIQNVVSEFFLSSFLFQVTGVPIFHSPLGQNKQKPRCKYWVTHLSIHSFTPPLIHSLAHFAYSLAHGTVND